MTDRAQGLAALCSAKLIATYPSLGIDQTLADLDHEPRCPPVVVSSSETAAGYVAEGFAATSGERVVVLVDGSWAHCVRPPLIPSARVDLASVDGNQIEILVAPEPVRAEPPTPDQSVEPAPQSRRFVVVLPHQFHDARPDAEHWVRESGMGAVTTSSFDSFPRSDSAQWLGRVGFMADRDLLNARTASGLDVAWVLLPGSELGSSIPGGRVFVASVEELTALRAEAEPDHRAASLAEEFTSPLPKILIDLARRLPTSLAVADAGLAHRAVAAAMANRGHECLMTDVLTPMGWSLPAALGASFAHPGRPLVVVIGDGSALGAVTDLALLAAHAVPAIVVIALNGTLGSRAGRIGSQDTVGLELPVVDWAELCAAIGIPVATHEQAGRRQLDDLVANLESGSGPQVLLVDCAIELPDELARPTGIPSVDDHFRSLSVDSGRSLR